MSEALWDLGRGTGVVALVMFTVTIVLGILSRSGRSVAGLGRFGVTEVHRTAALTGTTLVAVHVTSLFFDPYAQLRLVDVVFPFLGAYRPLWLGLGTLAVDLLLVVVTVSLLREKSGHGSSAPCTGRRTPCGRSRFHTRSATAPTAASWCLPWPRPVPARSSSRLAGGSPRRTPNAAGPGRRGGSPHGPHSDHPAAARGP